MLPFLHGVPRVGSPASPVLRSTPTSCRPSRVASFPSLRATVAAPWVCSHGCKAQHLRAGGCLPGSPKPVHRRRPQDLPGSWRTPLCTRPALRPRRDLCARPLLRFGVVFRLIARRRLLRKLHFEAPSHGPHTRCLRFAGWIAPPPRKTRFRLAGLPFPGGTGYPLGPIERFQTVSSSSPRLHLAHAISSNSPHTSASIHASRNFAAVDLTSA